MAYNIVFGGREKAWNCVSCFFGFYWNAGSFDKYSFATIIYTRKTSLCLSPITQVFLDPGSILLQLLIAVSARAYASL